MTSLDRADAAIATDRLVAAQPHVVVLLDRSILAASQRITAVHGPYADRALAETAGALLEAFANDHLDYDDDNGIEPFEAVVRPLQPPA